jgi:hypothetical protein
MGLLMSNIPAFEGLMQQIQAFPSPFILIQILN